MSKQHDAPHVPVLLSGNGPSVLSLLRPKPGDAVLDATVGLGGHAEAMLSLLGEEGRLVGLDVDQENLRSAGERLGKYGKRVHLLHKNFRDVASLLPQTFDVILADLGLSSPHIDDPKRGFTFKQDAPLDMRYDRSKGRSAALFLSRAREEELVTIFSKYGELPRSRTLAKVIVDSRKEKEIETSEVLRACVQHVYHYKTPSVLSQVYQALRIAVNDELGALEDFLDAVPELLRAGGRCGIISYHSLEDRIVKNRFRLWTTAAIDERTGAEMGPADFELLTRKPISPSAQEQAQNPRSRSAKLRAIQKRVSLVEIPKH